MKWDLGSGLTAEAAPHGDGLRVLVMLGDAELAHYDVTDVAAMDAVIDAIVAVAAGDAPAAPVAAPEDAEDDFGGAPAALMAPAVAEDDFGGGGALLESASRDEWEFASQWKLSLVSLVSVIRNHQREHGANMPWKAWAEATSSDILRGTFGVQLARPSAGGKPLPSGFRAGPLPGHATGEEYKCEANITEASGLVVQITQNVGSESRDVNIATDAGSFEEVCAATREVLYHPRVALYLARFDVEGDGSPEIVGTVTTAVVQGRSKLLIDPLVLSAPQTLTTAAETILRRLAAAGYALSSPMVSELSSEAIQAAAERAAQGEVIFAPLVLVEPKGSGFAWEIHLVSPAKFLTGDVLLKIAERAAPGHAMEQKRTHKHGMRWTIQAISGHSISMFKRVVASLARERDLLGAVWAKALDLAEIPEGYYVFDDKRRGYYSLPELRAVWDLPAAPAASAPAVVSPEAPRVSPADVVSGDVMQRGTWPESNVELRDAAEFAPKIGTARVVVAFPDSISVEFYMENEADGATMARRLADVWGDVYDATRDDPKSLDLPGQGTIADVRTSDCQRSLFGEVCENRASVSLLFAHEEAIGVRTLKRAAPYSASVEWGGMLAGDQRECAAGFALYFDALSSFFSGARGEITSVEEKHTPLVLPTNIAEEPYFANPSALTFQRQFGEEWDGAVVLTEGEVRALGMTPAFTSSAAVFPAPLRSDERGDLARGYRADGGGLSGFEGVYPPGALCVVWLVNHDLVTRNSSPKDYSLAWLRSSVFREKDEARYLVLDFIVSRDGSSRMFAEDDSLRDSLSVIHGSTMVEAMWMGTRTFPHAGNTRCLRVMLPAAEVCVVPVSTADGFFTEERLLGEAETMWAADSASDSQETDEDGDVTSRGNALVVYLDAPESTFYEPNLLGAVKRESSLYRDNAPSLMFTNASIDPAISAHELMRLMAKQYLSAFVSDALERAGVASAGATYAEAVLRESKRDNKLPPRVSIRILWEVTEWELKSLRESGADDAPSRAREIAMRALMEGVKALNAKQGARDVTLKLSSREAASLAAAPSAVDAPVAPAVSSVVMEPVKSLTPSSDAVQKAGRVDVAKVVSALKERGIVRPGAAEKVAAELVKAIETGVYNDSVHPDNAVTREVFASVTGSHLPKGVRATQSAFSGTPHFVLGEWDASSSQAVSSEAAEKAARLARLKERFEKGLKQ